MLQRKNAFDFCSGQKGEEIYAEKAAEGFVLRGK